MPDDKAKNESEWEKISNGDSVVTVGFFDEDGNICEITEVNQSDMDTIDQISSDMDLKNLFNAVLNC